MSAGAPTLRGLPAPGPSRTVPLPRPHERYLDNGLRVIAVSSLEIPANVRAPLVAAALSVRHGSAADPPERAGLAAMTAALLGVGTRRRSALEFGAASDALGARLDRSALFDVSTSSASATTNVFEDALELMAETIREPAFAADEFERVRARSLSDLKLLYSSPSALARLVFSRAIGGDSPYAHAISGTERSLSAMTRDEVVAFHAAAYRPEHAILLIGGEIDVDAAFLLAERVFGDWKAEARTPVSMMQASEPPSPRSRVVAIDRPEAGRTALAIGRLAIPRASEAYYAGIMTCGALSGYSGRLNQEVRVKRGLSYGAGAQLIARGRGGSFVASTLVDHDRAAYGVEVVAETLRSLVERPPDGPELTARKAALLGGWTRGLETTDGLINALGDYALHNIPLDELERYTARIEAIEPAQIAAFAGTYVVPDTCTVLVGDASRFAGDLSRLAPETRIIPFADLDLDHAI
ncbi:MAG: insulinase family protein [Candidatus Eremiobacteraeota bacterium]|nr:insulinase family protein [Candidatus Eremiobacteraeota bacterium]